MSDRMFMKGFTFGWMAKRGEYKTEQTIESLKKLKETGTEWIALAFDIRQENFYSTKIYFDYGYTVTDREIALLIDKAHDMGFKVCLKPVINLNDGLWRARITFPDDNNYWDEWFDSYNNLIGHYAEIAEETKCEMFCIGCEMIGTERKSEHWRNVIKSIRNLYSGLITYNANHGKESEIDWLDEVDIIGTSAYYPVAEKPGDCEENMMVKWKEAKENLYKIHKKFNKPILFIEIGCRSAFGCASMPWDWQEDFPYDEDEQAMFYSSAMKSFWDEEWFCGFFWWDWKHNLYNLEEAKQNRDFCIYGKKAEGILKDWYKNK
ncbi:hypothetical protein HMPREF1982_01074 [Clostridiales bacterium oral taxon 876 str. F0540]|nr:hypothetical protein HMPREF1982_01074 [Clostridiales bacterium oral taxon 876 str. F0540]